MASGKAKGKAVASPKIDSEVEPEAGLGPSSSAGKRKVGDKEKGKYTKTGRRKQRRDPAAPKRARTAFNFFLADFRQKYLVSKRAPRTFLFDAACDLTPARLADRASGDAWCHTDHQGKRKGLEDTVQRGEGALREEGQIREGEEPRLRSLCQKRSIDTLADQSFTTAGGARESKGRVLGFRRTRKVQIHQAPGKAEASAYRLLLLSC